MILRMTGLCLIWYIIAFSLFDVFEGEPPQLDLILESAMPYIQIGALLGLIAAAVGILFGEVRNPLRFKLAVAIFTSVLPASFTIVALLYMLASELSSAEVLFLLIFMSNIPCVLWFSQIVARIYLREISPRKRKVNPE